MGGIYFFFLYLKLLYILENKLWDFEIERLENGTRNNDTGFPLLTVDKLYIPPKKLYFL